MTTCIRSAATQAARSCRGCLSFTKELSGRGWAAAGKRREKGVPKGLILPHGEGACCCRISARIGDEGLTAIAGASQCPGPGKGLYAGVGSNLPWQSTVLPSPARFSWGPGCVWLPPAAEVML